MARATTNGPRDAAYTRDQKHFLALERWLTAFGLRRIPEEFALCDGMRTAPARELDRIVQASLCAIIMRPRHSARSRRVMRSSSPGGDRLADLSSCAASSAALSRSSLSVSAGAN